MAVISAPLLARAPPSFFLKLSSANIVGRSITALGAPCVFVDSEERAMDQRKQRAMNAERIEGDWSVGHRSSAARWFPVF